jgi:D-alanyl-lipoteichoic acid acyltransferase DltB (MBOAT superfamily)
MIDSQQYLSRAHDRAGDSPLPHGRVWNNLGPFVLVLLELALILLTVYLFKIEPNLPFLAVLCLAAGGFLVHAWLPPRFRLAFFCLLSLASAVLLFGWQTAGWFLGLGGVLIALPHLPVPWKYRVLLIAAAGFMLALWRIESTESFWPLLASMFMFRLIVYVYDCRHERTQPPLWHTLAYFFALPNLCFTLFPVIDFKTFRQTYYDDEPYTVYQSGVSWIVRGLTHLLAYRFVKYYLLPAPHQLADLPNLLLFLGANYALYLRISGWFHIITGMLHLFGFNLPRTHQNYFLASSVSDVWRRINIYWKDFMAKVFFYPAFFALHGWGRSVALVVASLWVFVVTWLLHSYQVFWLRGELPLTPKGAILWLSAGGAATVSLLFDLRRAGKDSRPAPSNSGREWLRREALAAAVHTLKIAGTFLLVSFFWACWTVPRFVVSLRGLAVPSASAVPSILAIGACVGSMMAAGVLVQFVWTWLHRRRVLPLTLSFSGSAVLQAAVLLALVAAGIPRVGETFGPQVAEVLATLRLEATTPVEAAVAVQGYYEEIADTSVQASPLVGLPGLPERKRPPPVYTDMSRRADDFLERDLIPGWSGEIAGHHLTVNNLGMRDRPGITQEKPAGVCRLAFVGSSVLMGYGVGDEETFTRLLEAHLNAARPGGVGRVEVLNFGTGKSHAIHRLTLIERKVLAFNPDAIYYVAHQDEYLGTVRHLTMLLDRRNELPVYLSEIVQQAGIRSETPPGQVEARLQSFAPQILRGIYADIVQQCRQRGTLPVWIYLPLPGVRDAKFESLPLMELAKESGFIVLNLAKWDAGHAPEAVKADRYHTNALGHQLIAERLGTLLRERSDALPACAHP